MSLLTTLIIGLVALIHAGILVVEMFLWRRPAVHTRLGFTKEQANQVAPIVANAGLFNGFLAAGLVWGLVSPGDAVAIETFFLSCVVVAGLFGAVTLKWTTLVIQSVPAAAALVAVWAVKA